MQTIKEIIKAVLEEQNYHSKFDQLMEQLKGVFFALKNQF
jgi:hypothetical protein